MTLALAGLGSAVVQGFLTRRIIPRLGERRWAVIGSLLTLCAYLCIAFAPLGWIVLLGILLQAAGAITNPAVQGLVSANAPADRQGETQGALSSLQNLTAIASPLVAGWLFSHFTGPSALAPFPGASFVASALACGVATRAVSGIRPPPALVEGRSEVLVAAAAGATVSDEIKAGGT